MYAAEIPMSLDKKIVLAPDFEQYPGCRLACGFVRDDDRLDYDCRRAHTMASRPRDTVRDTDRPLRRRLGGARNRGCPVT